MRDWTEVDTAVVQGCSLVVVVVTGMDVGAVDVHIVNDVVVDADGAAVAAADVGHRPFVVVNINYFS